MNFRIYDSLIEKKNYSSMKSFDGCFRLLLSPRLLFNLLISIKLEALRLRLGFIEFGSDMVVW